MDDDEEQPETSEEATAAAARRCFGGVAAPVAREAAANAPPPPPPPGEVRVAPVRLVVPCGWAPPEPEPTPEPADGGAPEQAAEPPPPPPLEARVRVSGAKGDGAPLLGPATSRWVPAAWAPGRHEVDFAGLVVPSAPLAQDAATATALFDATVDVRVETREGEGAAVVDLGACRLRVRDVVDAATLGRPCVEYEKPLVADPSAGGGGDADAAAGPVLGVALAVDDELADYLDGSRVLTLRASLWNLPAGWAPVGELDAASDAALAACRFALHLAGGTPSPPAIDLGTAGLARDAAPAAPADDPAATSVVDAPADAGGDPADGAPVGVRAAWAEATAFMPRDACEAFAAAAGDAPTLDFAVSVAGGDGAGAGPAADGAAPDDEAPEAASTAAVDIATATLDMTGFYGGVEGVTAVVEARVVAPAPEPVLATTTVPAGAELLAPSADDDDVEEAGGDDDAVAADEGADADAAPPEAPPLASRLDAAGTRLAVALALSAPLRNPAPPAATPYGDVVVQLEPHAVAGAPKKRDVPNEFRDAVGDVVTELAEEMARIVVARDPTGGASVDGADERTWLYALNTGRVDPDAPRSPGPEAGPYHAFKERLKPCVQRVVRARAAKPPPAPGQNADWREIGAYDRFVAAAYENLLGLATPVLNRRFRDAESAQEPPAKPSPFAPDDADAPSTDLAETMARDADQTLRTFAARAADAEAEGDAAACARLLDEAYAAVKAKVLSAWDAKVLTPVLHAAARSKAFALARCAGRRLAGATAADAAAACRAALELESGDATETQVLYAAALLERGDVSASAGVLTSATVAARGAVGLRARLLRALVLTEAGPRFAPAARRAVDAAPAAAGWAPPPGYAEGPRRRCALLLDLSEWLDAHGLPVCACKALGAHAAADARAAACATRTGDLFAARTPAGECARRWALDARAAADAGDAPGATAAAMRACAAGADAAAPWLALGAAAAARGDGEREGAALASALAILQHPAHPDPPPLWLFLRVADLCVASGKTDYARDVALAACDRHATRAAAWRGAARALLVDGNPKDAETALEEANVLDPASAACWGYLALANLRQYDLGDDSRVDRAAACAEHATQLGLADGNLMTDVGVAFTAVDRLTVAVDVLQRAVALPFGDFTKHARLALARAYAKGRRLVEATDEYATLLGVAAGAEAGVLRAEMEPILKVLGKLDDEAP